MLDKVSDVLNAFIAIEQEKLAGVDLKHMPTLGEAYEQITNQGFDQDYVIPKGLDLKVVSGFVRCGDKVLEQQIDGMLVCGEGEEIGLTGKYFYPIEQVLCLFEVKKTLTKADMSDAFDHLKAIRYEFGQYFEGRLRDGHEPDISAARRHFSQLTGKKAPETYLGMHDLSRSDGILFYALIQESLAPSSIIQGYGGYKSENGLRNGFLDTLYDKGEKAAKDGLSYGLGVPSIPSLITSNNYCLVKSNGIPYIAMTEDRKWAVLSSCSSNPIRIMLDIIWSKISVYFDVRMPWGEDLLNDNLQPLLLAIPEQIGEGDSEAAAWRYEPIHIAAADLKAREQFEEWAPIKVGPAMITFFNMISVYGGELDLPTFEYVCEKHKLLPGELRRQITDTLLFSFDSNRRVYHPINKLTILVSDGEDEDGGYMSSDQNRIDNWCEKNGLGKGYMVLYAEF